MEQKTMDRLGMFVFYDPQGMVDRYVTELLKALRPNFKRLIVISNVKLQKDGREALENCCDDLFVRKNIGYDAAAFKEGLTCFCTWDEVGRYDEVVLMNDTFFGPNRPFSEIFDTMAQRDLDFWGLAAGYSSVDGWKRVQYGYIPDHIQTFFIAFRKEMVCSPAFHDYWHRYDGTMNDFATIVSQHEVIFTKHFQDLGFRWGIYANTEAYHFDQLSENFNIYYYLPHKMIKELQCPILKKKILQTDLSEYLYMTDLEGPAEALGYLQEGYDLNMVWDHILRIDNMGDIYKALHLNYVFPSGPETVPRQEKAALVFFVGNPFFVDRVLECAERIESHLDMYLIPGSETVGQRIREKLCPSGKLTLLEETHQSSAMSGFVLRCKELADRYEYLGFVHDVDNPMHVPMTVPESALYGYLQNIANDSGYIDQIVDCFSRNPRLGLLGAPFPIHHEYFGTYGNEWGSWFEDTRRVSEELEIRCPMDAGKPPVTISGAFWCRTAALSPLWRGKWTEDRFYKDPVTKLSTTDESLKRVLPFAAQSEGYYTGIVMHTNYASMRLTSQQYMLDQIVQTTREKLNCFAGFYAGYMDQLRNATMPAPPTSQEIIVKEQIGVRGALNIYLKKHLPGWMSKFLIRILRLDVF